MYGQNIHKAVLYKQRENISGLTIHYVNEKYDDGAIIFQKEVFLDPLVKQPMSLSEENFRTKNILIIQLLLFEKLLAK